MDTPRIIGIERNAWNFTSALFLCDQNFGFYWSKQRDIAICPKFNKRRFIRYIYKNFPLHVIWCDKDSHFCDHSIQALQNFDVSNLLRVDEKLLESHSLFCNFKHIHCKYQIYVIIIMTVLLYSESRIIIFVKWKNILFLQFLKIVCFICWIQFRKWNWRYSKSNETQHRIKSNAKPTRITYQIIYK